MTAPLLRRRHLLAAPLLALGRAARADDTVVLGRFATTYLDGGEHKGRASNVQLAAEAIDGRSVGPGATFSFDDAVGERTASFGWARATVLRDGMTAEGTGGGACQVASTLHAAALLAGLEIVLRAPHTRPSAYIRMGLDATVAYGRIDLRVRNATAGPVTVRARAANGTLEVAIVAAGGAAAPPRVVLASEIVERTSFARVVERERGLDPDVVRVVTFGIPGYRVRRTRDVARGDSPPLRDVRVDVYPAVNEVVRVAPGFDESRLARSGPPMDEEEEARQATALRRIVDPRAVRPAPVQLRPSSRVVLDNGR